MTIEIEDEFADRVRELLWYLRDRKEQEMSGCIEFHTDRQGNTQQGKATLNGGLASMKKIGIDTWKTRNATKLLVEMI